MVAFERVFVALLASYCCCIVSADNRYNMNGWNVTNTGRLYNLDKDRSLTGIWAGIRANRSGPIDFQLWFVNSTLNSFTLSIIAINSYTVNFDTDNLHAKVIWSANPDRPVGLNATLVCGSAGNLDLIDVDKTVKWTSNTDGSQVDELWMTDMGNMVLLTNTYVKWQSFDYLTDTLPFRRVLKPGKKMTSSISMKNRTEGPYSLHVERERLVLYSRFGEETYWVWNTASSTNEKIFAALCTIGTRNILELGTNFSSFTQTNMALSGDCDTIQPVGELYVGNSETDATFLNLQPDGDLDVVAWNDGSGSWDTIFSLFGNISCQLPRKCGPFRTCTSGVCGECPVGFVDVDPKQKKLGCRQNVSRRSSESCSTDAFQEVKGYHYFAASFTEPMATRNKTAEECLRQCSENCSCQASFFRQENGNSYCYISVDVGTIQKMTSASTYRAYIRLHVNATSSQNSSQDGTARHGKKSLVPAIVGGAVGAFMIPLVTLIILGIMRRKAAANGRSNVPEVYDSDKQHDETMRELSMSSLPRLFSPTELQKITNGYSHKLGAGGFGVVFKGILENGVQVAVKKLGTDGDSTSQQHRKQFYAEVEVLAKTKHWNLVQLLGFSTKNILVYEFMENSSLDTWLFNEEKKVDLTWEIRFNIALGTARGLSYLHEDCSEKIIHLDLKPQNILLDSEFNAKIGDFGLSKPMNRQQSYAMTTMKGTPGYLAPDWLVDGVITEKIDVYTYGIVLLELVAGRKYKSFSSGPPVESTMELVDKSLHVVNEQQADRAVRVALLCMQNDPGRRPSMSTVVQVLLGVQPIPALQDCEIFFCRSTPPVFTNLMKVGTSTSGSSSSAFHSTSFESLQLPR